MSQVTANATAKPMNTTATMISSVSRLRALPDVMGTLPSVDDSRDKKRLSVPEWPSWLCSRKRTASLAVSITVRLHSSIFVPRIAVLIIDISV